ncbi:MAG: DUF1385 domain-containing protein [Deferribacteraceae bacterium]|jgi:uncharacterized protein YqhQ|nr:DUF1385 domain-containing protein [Deferribacteraceae bacterium]
MSESVNKANNKACLNIGGQAIIEGVMMRAPGQLAMAVRQQNGVIVVRKEPIKIDHSSLFKKPFFRGMVGLYDSLVLGIKALNFSAQHAGLDDEKPLSKRETVLSLVIGLGVGILLFLFLPLWLTNLMKAVFPLIEESFLVFNLVDGLIRVVFFVAYIAIISRMKDIQRVFQYHGAEHKSIFAYEEGLELTVENARKMSRFHPRCGTSFLLIVMIVAIFVFSLIPKDSAFVIKFGSRIVFLPVIAGISYEVLKLSGRLRRNPIVAFLMAPGLWLQRLTTREPDDSQLEVALVSIKTALVEEQLQMDGVDYV